MLKRKITVIGGSYSIVIPKVLCELIGIDKDSMMGIHLMHDKIFLEKITGENNDENERSED